VLLPEAGSARPIPAVADPTARPALAGTSVDWAYETVPQAETEGATHQFSSGGTQRGDVKTSRCPKDGVNFRPAPMATRSTPVAPLAAGSPLKLAAEVIAGAVGPIGAHRSGGGTRAGCAKRRLCRPARTSVPARRSATGSRTRCNEG
jgi:hypothetical protein